MRSLLLLTLATLLPMCAAGQIIDYHQHLYSPAAGVRSTPGPKGISASDLIAHMDAAGIERAVVLSVAYSFANPNKPKDPTEYADVMAENDWTARQVAQYPGRLVGFCGVNPLSTYAVQEIERCAKNANLRTGLKLHFGNSDVDVTRPDHAAQLRRVFRAANQHHMALAMHIRPTVDLNRPYGAKQARALLDLLSDAPDVTIQIAHLAGPGGYDDPSIDEAVGVYVEAIKKNDARMKNVYFDMTSVTGMGDWKGKADLVVKRMHQIGIQRLLYGSDAALPGNFSEEALQHWHQLPLTTEEFHAIETNVAPYLR